MSHELNLPQAEIKVKNGRIWDMLRNKYVQDTPEERVRQRFIHYMVHHLNYPKGRMASEYTVNYYNQQKRCDIVVFSDGFKAEVIVECKSPSIKITEDTFYQIAKYTHILQAKLLILTNGIEHYCAYIDRQNNEIRYLEELPKYGQF